MNRFNVTVSVNKEHSLVSDTIKNLRNNVALDLSFNSEERWESKQVSQYLSSLITGKAPSKIIIAKIDECLAHCNEDSADYNYFMGWKQKGFEYIALDGNNRTININKYLNDDATIAHGEYVLPTGPVVIDGSNDKFSTHPKALRDYIQENVTVHICNYIIANRSDLSTLFININDGVKLNHQELRNAILVPFAHEVRELVSKYIDSFKYIFKNGNGRRVVDEQIVLLSVYWAFGAENGISKTDKDRAYEDNSTVWNNFRNGGKKCIEETLKLIADYGDKGFKSPSILLNLFMLTSELNKSKRKILNREQFFKWFMRTENRRLGSTRILVKKMKGEHRNYSSCCDTTSAPELVARYKELMKDLENIDEGIVADIDNERLFTNTQRYQLWSRQDGVCAICGKECPEEEIQNHDLWAADHVIPHSKGGKTTLDNGQLTCKKCNLKKGAKILQDA